MFICYEQNEKIINFEKKSVIFLILKLDQL